MRQKLLEKGLIIAAQDVSRIVGLTDFCRIFWYGNKIKRYFFLFKASEVISGEESLDLVDEDTKKSAAKKAKKQAVTAESLVKLREFCQIEIDNHEAEKKLAKERRETAPLNLNTRSVEDLKKMYRKAFLKLSTGKGTCEHCGAVTKNIVHYRSR